MPHEDRSFFGVALALLSDPPPCQQLFPPAVSQRFFVPDGIKCSSFHN